MIILDLFSGIGGFSKGFLEAGYDIKKHYFSEIDKHAIANYKYNFKNSEYVGSVTDVRGSELERANIITFGSPCQDFSQAGNRTGLDGSRSSLIHEAIRLVREIKPDVFIWENVKGAFSSNEGADFQAILTAFANVGGYRLEWQLLNTSWFLPQNRERIYLIGHLAGSSEPKVFPISETNRGTFKRVSEAPVVITLTAGGNSGGHHSGMTLVRQINNISEKQPYQQDRVYCPSGHSVALTKGAGSINISVQAVSTVGRETKNQNGKRIKTDGEPMFSLTCQDNHGVLIDNKIRRLTEIECERLQGFPDKWTENGIYENESKPISSTQRYKLLGNSVSVPIITEIAKRLDLKT